VASVAQDHGAEVASLGTIGTRPCDLDQRIRQLPAKCQPLVCIYEASPCGSWLDRDVPKQGDECWVVAPSVLPNKAGDRVNTDRRDAGQLARLMRSGDLTPGDVPQVADEAIRALSRAREDTIRDRKAAQFRLNACLLRHAIRSRGQATWGPAHWRWLAAGVCPPPAQHMVFPADVRALTAHPARLGRLAPARHDQVQSGRVSPVVEALQARRGVQFTVAVTPVAARGDLTRVEHPRPRRQCVGLIPAAYASGERRRQGTMTTAGHPQARRALVDGAWSSRDPANVSRHLPLRREPHPKALQEISGKAHVQLCTRVRRLLARGQQANQVVVAMARARVGCMGAMATQVPVTPEVPPTDRPWTHNAPGWPHRSEEAPPRCGATLDGVKRRQETRVPQARPAPDGRQSGGTQPTESSRINRRVGLAPPLPMTNWAAMKLLT
jgi:transposase